MSTQKENKLIEVFAGDFHQAAIIKSMLENNGIYVFVENQHMGSIAPWQVSSGGFNPVRLIISDQDQEQATKLMADFDREEPLDSE